MQLSDTAGNSKSTNGTKKTPHYVHHMLNITDVNNYNYPEPPKNGSLYSGEKPPPNMRSAVEGGRVLP